MTDTSRRVLWHGATVVLAALLAYALALAGVWVYDDFHSVAANPHIREIGNPLRFFWQPEAFSATGMRMYRPVLVLSFALNFQLGSAPIWFKAGNLAIHAAVAWLLWQWLRSWNVPLRAATIAAVLFAVHPLGSEAVNLVSGRSELLLVAGTLLALVVHRGGLDTGMVWWRQVVLVLATLVACGSKETGVLLPVLLLGQAALLRLEAGERLAALRWWGGVLVRIAVVVGLVCGYLIVRRHLLGMATASLAGRVGDDPLSGAGRDLVTQIATMGTLLPRVLLQAVVPVGISLEPPVVFLRSLFHPCALVGWVSVLWFTGLGLRRLRHQPLRAAGVMLAWAMALPWVVIPLNVPLSEHRLYGVLVGLAVVLATLLQPAARSLPVPPWSFLGRAALPVAAAVLLAGLSAKRSSHYGDERALWRHALWLAKDSYRAHWGLGLAMVRHGDLEAALPHLRRARENYPGSAALWRSELEAWLDQRPERQAPFRAVVLAEELLAMMPNEPFHRILAARAMTQAGQRQPGHDWLARAETMALSCLQIAPPKGLVYTTAAAARQATGDLDGALALLDTSVARGLDHWTVLLERVELHERLGRRLEAERDVLRAQQQAPFEAAVQHAFLRVFQVEPGR
ncbi:MAG: tetratricopeptide repeat protein [Planctomycetes bacterium]|nr:tetratricopeptide repeat protein [Planctomycetota bacterium]